MTDVKQNDVEPSSTGEPTATERQVQQSLESDEVTGLKSAKEAETQKRQDAEQRALFAEQMLQTMQTQASVPQAQEEVDPYDYATNESVERMVQDRVDKALFKSNADVAQQNYQRTKEKYDDFDKVVGPNSYFDQIQRDNPGLMKKIQELPNAAEIAYRIGQSHSEYQKQKIEKATKGIADQIDANTKKTSTLSDVGGADTSIAEIDKYEKMSDTELDAEIRRVTGRQ